MKFYQYTINFEDNSQMISVSYSFKSALDFISADLVDFVSNVKRSPVIL